ncbi:MAG TPA: acetate kinase [Candidatus Eremiobacteraeota bacterium]|nr:acetate kinase [Candidatus Eremiobacteraeota bacterium]
MNILVLNCGSSSAKFQLIQAETEDNLARGIVERIGTTDAIVRYQPKGRNEYREVTEISNHAVAIQKIIDMLTHPRHGMIKNLDEIMAIGHRVVHGAEKFANSVVITDEVIQQIEDCIKFAPLHNPHNLKGIKECARIIPGKPQVGVFDTAFHQQMPPSSYIYALPYSLYKKMGIRRYGFHGTSHYYVSRKAAEILKRPVEELKMITCHLGNGASITAVKGGISVDTSMGFTPLEGLVMGTRCGDIDPAIITYLMEREGLKPAEMDKLMNSQSGLKGISERSNDMREIIEGAERGEYQFKLALDVFSLRIKKYIGAYAAEMGGLDAVIFTGGIGENAVKVRELVCEGLEFLGIVIDKEKNNQKSLTISTGRTAVLCIPTNEELVIAQETKKLVEEKRT